MTRLQHTIKRARRRHTLNRIIHAAGVGVSLGVAAAFVMLLVERLVIGGRDLGWEFFAVVAGVGFVLGAIWPLLRVPDLSEIALHLDRALRLKDRVATAHAMSVPLASVASLRTSATGPRYDDAFAELVRRDADRVAGIIDVRNVVPIRVTGVWGLAVVAAIVFAAGFLFLPNVAWGEESALTQERERITQEQREQLEIQREELLATIDETIDEAREEAAVDARTREQLEALERLSQQLQAAGSDEQDLQHLRDESAALMNELSRSLAEQAQREQLASEKVAERFSRLEAPDMPMTAEEFTEALRRGDFGRAADSLDELLARRDEMTPQQRTELAEHLQELSQQLDETGQRERQELAERAAQLEQALRELGVEQEMIEQLLSEMPRSEEELTQELLDEQLDEDLARRLARELQRLQEQREIERQAERDTQAVNEALRDAAEEFDRDVAQRDPQPAGEDEPIDEPRDGPDPDQQQDQPGEEPGEPGDPQRDQPGQQQEQPGQDEPARDQPTGDQPREGAQEDPEQTQQEREATEEQRGVHRDETREQAGEEGEAQAQPTDEAEGEGETAPQADPDGEGDPTEAASAPGEGDDPDGESAAQEQAKERSAGDAIREMQQRRQATEERRRSSERMRERARQMAEGAQQEHDPVAHEQSHDPMPMPGGADGAGDSSPQRLEGEAPVEQWEGEVEDLDVRDFDVDDPGELIAEWMDPEVTPREGDPQTRRVEVERRVREAQEIAERAVNEAAVPSRYHERIRRYFGRLNETVDRSAEGSGGTGEARDNTRP